MHRETACQKKQNNRRRWQTSHRDDIKFNCTYCCCFCCHFNNSSIRPSIIPIVGKFMCALFKNICKWMMHIQTNICLQKIAFRIVHVCVCVKYLKKPCAWECNDYNSNNSKKKYSQQPLHIWVLVNANMRLCVKLNGGK